MPSAPFDNVRVVLIETSHPGNIGAVARALKTMRLTSLTLVNPCHYPHADATARASGAADILEHALVVPDLSAALGDCARVIGASARVRELSAPEVDPRAAAALLAEGAAHGPVALVMGREKNGLTNAELELCHYLVRIPANPEYSSLNLASAVQLLAYEIQLMLLGGTPGGAPGRPAGADLPASVAEVEGLFGHLEQTLADVGFLDLDNPRRLMRRLRHVFQRAALDRTEVNILRGMLTAIGRAVHK